MSPFCFCYVSNSIFAQRKFIWVIQFLRRASFFSLEKLNEQKLWNPNLASCIFGDLIDDYTIFYMFGQIFLFYSELNRYSPVIFYP